jgi:hypothetical protein
MRSDGLLEVSDGCRVLGVPRDVDALAAELFALLRSAEELGLAHLVIEAVPGSDVGRAVMDRLRRASVASGGTTHGTVAP